ncbi:MAG: PAS domain S-box protein [Candidatus Lambdaproteobacteria bacterium]|nr:PAS domain S-box protein [Candidatus Lambdaproteobacteria bacterium]
MSRAANRARARTASGAGRAQPKPRPHRAAAASRAAAPERATGADAALQARAGAGLVARIEALEMELAQKDVLLHQGFGQFIHAAENLRESHKLLQQKVASLNLELDEKNRELERNLTEKEKVKAYLSNIFESLAIGVLVTDLQGAITSVNRAGTGLLGASAEALIGQPVNGLLHAAVLPANVPAAGGAPGAEPDEPLTYTRGGETLRLQVSSSPMHGEGRPLGYILNVQDVTLLKRLEEHAARRNRLTAMGEMAANIAHEIRNPLGSIELFASLVRKGLPVADEKVVLMDHIFSAVQSMNHIISNLLQYTKPRPVSRKALELNALLRDGAEFSGYLARHNGIGMALKLKARRSAIRGDGELLKQVFHNLFLNAVQAMPDGGTLTIASRCLSLSDPKLLARFGDLPPGARGREVIEVRLSDTGVGMPADVRRQIFDPFFTTKSRGTGLGLAIVHSILDSHQATIDVESRVGQGTTFTLMFPLMTEPGTAARAQRGKAG